jgi:hypothetical protein
MFNHPYLIGCGLLALVVGIFAIGILVWGVGVSNTEVTLRNQITAKQTDNKNQFDSMFKSQMQAFQVTDAQRQMLYDVIVGNSKARAGQGGGSLATSVTEAVPNLDKSSDLYTNLMNTVTSLRAVWTRKQTELIDYKREHDNLIDKIPSSIVCSLLGRRKIEITIVTSSRAENAFATGKDDDIDLRPRPIHAESTK